MKYKLHLHRVWSTNFLSNLSIDLDALAESIED